MKNTWVRAMVAAVMSVGLVTSAGYAQSFPTVPPVPAGLEAPDGHVLFLATRAEGTQNYICLSAGKRAVAWRFLGPQATVFAFSDATNVPQQINTHFLSMNPDEGLLARPTWQHSIDSSRVWGRVLRSSTDSNYVAAGAIPWLLLETAGTAVGPTGGGIMAQTTFIQRVNTVGGVAPATGCSNDDHIGTLALVPYVTDYFFYRAAQ